MATIQNITDLNEWQTLWDALKTPDAAQLCVLKRSPTCSISHAAEHAFDRYVAALPENPKLKIVKVDVISARPVSQRIAADTGIRHESPQVLLIAAGQKVLWSATHHDIDSAALKQHLVV